MRTVIFSLDYDCCADILFIELLERELKEGRSKYNSKTLQQLKELLCSLRGKLEKFLSEKASHSTKYPEVYNFSNRQFDENDLIGAKKNNNGCCYPNFSKYCSAKGWIFQDEVKMRNTQRDKNKIFAHQLQDIITKHPNPNDEVHWYILDDDSLGDRIFGNLQEYINKIEKEIPSNIHIHLVKFDWRGAAYKHLPLFLEIPETSGKKPLAETPESKSVYQSGLTTFEKEEERVVPQNAPTEKVLLKNEVI